MNVALIPVRGGSKSIPLKNIKIIGGKPLVYWTVKAACECEEIDRVYISTDSDSIKKTVEEFHFDKAVVINRNSENASDTASTESVMLEFAEKYEFEDMVLIQATSPLLTAKDLSEGFHVYQKPHYDSVLSVVKQKRFHWNVDADGIATPTNYDVFHRPRRQEFDGYYVENGAFYITSKKSLLASKNRVSGNIGIAEMNEDTYFEIDEPSDWVIIEALMKKNHIITDETKSIVIPTIKMFLTDCDGCLTDGGMYYSEQGDELKKFNTLDGMGFKLLREKGILTGIITGESVDLNRRRSEKMKLDILKEGVQDKVAVVQALCEEYQITMENVAYIGDDSNDLALIQKVGFGCSVQNALPQIKESAQYVTQREGGHGAVREVIELILNSF